jgi:hypothetical protein
MTLHYIVHHTARRTVVGLCVACLAALVGTSSSRTQTAPVSRNSRPPHKIAAAGCHTSLQRKSKPKPFTLLHLFLRWHSTAMERSRLRSARLTHIHTHSPLERVRKRSLQISTNQASIGRRKLCKKPRDFRMFGGFFGHNRLNGGGGRSGVSRGGRLLLKDIVIVGHIFLVVTPPRFIWLKGNIGTVESIRLWSRSGGASTA